MHALQRGAAHDGDGLRAGVRRKQGEGLGLLLDLVFEERSRDHPIQETRLRGLLRSGQAREQIPHLDEELESPGPVVRQRGDVEARREGIVSTQERDGPDGRIVRTAASVCVATVIGEWG